MKKIVLLLVVVIGLGITANAQDVITLKNGTDINALVQKIGEIEIEYKKFDNPNGPNYTLKKSEILMIRYANGSKDIFSEEVKSVETKDVSIPEVVTIKSNENAEVVYSSENMKRKKGVCVISGNASILKKKTTALLELDFSGTKVDGIPIDEFLKSQGDDYVRDFPQDKAVAANSFIECFNKKNKKGMHITGEGDYKIIIHITTLDYGFRIGALWIPFTNAKTGGCIIDGSIDIVNLKTNNIICTLRMVKIKGVADFSDRERLKNVFYEVAREITKVK